jgi:uncharacterized membrane protein YtjA (UPF0391 family)
MSEKRELPATLSSLDRLRDTVIWFANYRAAQLRLLLATTLTALGFYYGIGSTNTNVAKVLYFIPWGMFAGSLVAIVVDLGYMRQSRRIIRDCVKVEQETGTGINSFWYLEHHWLLDSRFVAVYLFVASFATYILIHDYGLKVFK